MNNPDHSTYHDFDDDDPEVGISFNHRIRWSFCLPAKQWLWLIEPQIFCDLGIVSRVAFTFTYAVLSLIQALSKSHSIFGKGSLKRKILKYIKSLLLFFNNFETVNVVCFSSPEFCRVFCCLFLCGVMFPSAKKAFIKMILYLCKREWSCSWFCSMVWWVFFCRLYFSILEYSETWFPLQFC